MTGAMTPSIVENGKRMEIHWPVGMKVVGGVLTLLIGVGVLALIDMRITLAVLVESFESHNKTLHVGAVGRHEIEQAHEACRDNIDALRDRISRLETIGG